jgi:myo-inositol-1(or 4)-monophosphatase
LTHDDRDPARLAAALEILTGAVREAGDVALRYFRPDAATSARIDYKQGGSPVTEADLAVDALLKRRLGAAFPEAGWLSEESADDRARVLKASLIVVDPIDGTRAYLSGDPRWAVSVALIEDGRPAVGVVHAPALRETYVASRGAGAFLNGRAIHASLRRDLDRARAAGPKPLVSALAKTLAIDVELVARIPSLAYRLCTAATGGIDFAIATANSHDWDVAAADLILEEAGARLLDAAGRRLAYNQAETLRGPLIAVPDALVENLLPAFRQVVGA